jgi:ferrous iron transport protein A
VRKLGELVPGQGGKIARVTEPGELGRRLMEIGLLAGAAVEVVHQAPFGGDPMAVRVRGALIALRRSEANWVELEGLAHE